MHVVPFRQGFQYPRIGFAELLFIKRIAKPFGRFTDLLFNLLIQFSQILFDKHVGAITFFTILVINQRIIKSIDMPRRFPNSGVHKDRGIQPNHIIMEANHRVPPILFDIVLELHPHRAVIVNSRQAIIYFTRWKYESVFLTMRYYFLKNIFLRHKNILLSITRFSPCNAIKLFF